MNETISYETLNIEQAWEAFISQKDESPEAEKTYEQARFGNGTCDFDLMDYLKGFYVHKAKKGMVSIGRHTLKREDMWTEIINRNAILKRYLLTYCVPKSFTKARTYEE